ncbi:hypothetical protein J6590_049462 [Homalodisca vitripennis]|nr:hypothetical protein J6590_049462 [Homalodisca vitripennis]
MSEKDICSSPPPPGERIQQVQDKFVRIVGVRNGLHCRDVLVEEIPSDMGLVSLEGTVEERSRMPCSYKFLNALIDCPQQLKRINLRVPSRTRSQELFVRLQLHTLFRQNRAIPRMQRIGCEISPDVDFLTCSPTIRVAAAESILARYRRE